MSDDKDQASEVSDEDREAQLRRAQNRPSLDEEIVRKYDPARLRRIVASNAGKGERLDLSTRSEMESLIPGHDFGSVRVFRGPMAEEVTARHKADAVTIGNTGMILVRESPRSAPGTSSARALMAHELTHVAQAQRGMLFAREGGGEGAHEKEAEHVEAQAFHGRRAARPDEGDQIRKEEARRHMIMERVFELLEEEKWKSGMRSGDTWSK